MMELILNKRIEELERKVKELELRPQTVINNHYHYPPAVKTRYKNVDPRNPRFLRG